MTFEDEDEGLMHYGILRKSGRYPWGSGKDEYARSRTFQQLAGALKAQGISETEMAKAMGLVDDKGNPSITRLRDTITIAKEEVIKAESAQASALKDKDWSIQAISDKMGIPPATVRSRIARSEASKKESLKNTAEAVRSEVDKHDIVDIGKGVSTRMGISPERLRAAVSILRDEGYETYTLQQPMPGSKHKLNQLVIVPKGTGFSGAARMADRVHTIGKWTENDKDYVEVQPPLSFSSKRLKVEHNSPSDGLIEVRAGVPDLTLGKNQYAQVRIAVDGTHFMKGIAVVRNDMPPGADIIYHTNKGPNTPLKADSGGILKKMKDDPDNPFGSSISRQISEEGPDGKTKVKSVMNIVNEEGDWDTWSNSLPSQMLAKQPQPLIRSQLAETVKAKQARLAEINSVTNPLLRKKLLEKEADQIDADAVDLRAVAMSPRQKTQVIIPVPKMSPNEVYAPNFTTGEKVVLIRYPHGGRFEIPEVVVNNNNRAAKKLLGNAPDAIGIHPKVAEKLSGADFDGDTVVVIPNPKGKIRGSTTLGLSARVYEQGLNDFDPKRKYYADPVGKDKDGKDVYPYPTMKNTGLEMGKITNLITDMSIQGAKPEHMVRAIRHSMVVIDAEKHNLDYKRSAQDNGIKQLQDIYRNGAGGATTLLSRATAKQYIPERKLRGARQGGPVDPVTGEKVFVNTNKTNNKYLGDGKYDPNVKVPKEQKEKLLALTTNAHTLVSDRKDPVELIYADHANTMKALANKARLDALKIPTPKMNPAAKKVYKAEVDDLVAQLNNIRAQKPLDRKANTIANAIIKQKRQEDPTLRYDQDRMKKVERQVRDRVRDRMNLEKQEIHLSDKAWDAIQAGAVSSNVFSEILAGNYVSSKRLLELALPKHKVAMTAPVLARAKAMLAAGMTNADIAAALGVSASTIRAAALKGDL